MDGPQQASALWGFLPALLGRALDPRQCDTPQEHDGEYGKREEAEGLMGGAVLLGLLNIVRHISAGPFTSCQS